MEIKIKLSEEDAKRLELLMNYYCLNCVRGISVGPDNWTCEEVAHVLLVLAMKDDVRFFELGEG